MPTTTKRTKSTGKPGTGRQGQKGKAIPWDASPKVLDRMDEAARFRGAGISRQQIIKTQHIDRTTYARDERRLTELRHLRILVHEKDAFRHSVDRVQWMLDQAERLYENPDSDPNVKARALDAMHKAVNDYNDLYRLTQPKAGESMRVAGTGDTTLTQNNTIVASASPVELFEMLQNTLARHKEQMDEMDLSVDSQRREFGSDNVIPVGQRLSSHYDDGSDSEDEDDED